MTAQPSDLPPRALSRPCVCLLRIAALLAMTAPGARDNESANPGVGG